MPTYLKKVNDKIVKKYVALRKEQDVRQIQRRIMLTDPKTCFEYPGVITELLVCEEFNGTLPRHDHQILTSNEVLRKISGMTNHADFVAIVDKPEPKIRTSCRRILFLEHIQNPGNLGTIIRSALAFNFDAIFMTHDSCDPFNDKTIRAAKSALFHLPIFKIKIDQFIEKFHDFTFYKADTKGIQIDKTPIAKKSVLILSNEGSGPSSSFDCQRITIGMNEKVESLNVAAAANILMHAFNRSLNPRQIA